MRRSKGTKDVVKRGIDKRNGAMNTIIEDIKDVARYKKKADEVERQ